MGRVRLFTAVDVGAAIRQQAAVLQQMMIKGGAVARWVEPAAMHVTLHFLGEVDERDLHTVCKVMMAATRKQRPFRLAIGGVGAFPTVRRPKTIWAGIVAGTEELHAIHAAAVPGIIAAGVYRREDRGYQPHLTLGRVKDDADSQPLAALLAESSEWSGGDTIVNEVLVMRSELRREGPEYSVVGRAELGG